MQCQLPKSNMFIAVLYLIYLIQNTERMSFFRIISMMLCKNLDNALICAQDWVEGLLTTEHGLWYNYATCGH